jgi:hypothetical protein
MAASPYGIRVINILSGRGEGYALPAGSRGDLRVIAPAEFIASLAKVELWPDRSKTPFSQ